LVTFTAGDGTINTILSGMVEKGKVGILVGAGDMGALVHLFVQFHEGVEDLIGNFFGEAKWIHRLVTKQTPFG
jgi:hypothetical protein